MSDFCTKFNRVLHHKVCEDGNWIIILVDIKASDGRLLKSDYFDEHKVTWFDNVDALAKKLPDNVIELTSREKEELDFIIDYVESTSNYVVSKGWFDDVYTYCGFMN